MVPSGRLISLSALLGLPLSFLYGFVPEAAPLCLAALTLFACAAILDLAVSLGRFDGLKLGLSPVLRFAKGKEGLAQLTLTHPLGGRLRAALEWPEALAPESAALEAELEPGKPRTYEFKLMPKERGQFSLPRAFFGMPSVMGLWELRQARKVEAEARVYPSLRRERKLFARLQLQRGLGLRRSRQAGKGRDFEKLRDYVPGDAFTDIHWKAMARKAAPVTKVYQIERTQQVVVVMDASRLSAREAGENETLLERSIAAALILQTAVQRQGDHFGLLAYGSRVLRFLPARRGKGQESAARETLYHLFPDPSSPDFDELFAFLNTRLRSRTLLLFLSSLDDPVLQEGFLKNLNLLTRRHLVSVLMPRPHGLSQAFSRALEPGEGLGHAYAADLRFSEMQKLKLELKARGAGFSLVDQASLAMELVERYMEVKDRQLL